MLGTESSVMTIGFCYVCFQSKTQFDKWKQDQLAHKLGLWPLQKLDAIHAEPPFLILSQGVVKRIRLCLQAAFCVSRYLMKTLSVPKVWIIILPQKQFYYCHFFTYNPPSVVTVFLSLSPKKDKKVQAGLQLLSL